MFGEGRTLRAGPDGTVTVILTYLPTAVFRWYSVERPCPCVLRNWQSRSHHVSQQPSQINTAVSNGERKMSLPSDLTFSSTLVIFNWHLRLTFEHLPRLFLLLLSLFRVAHTRGKGVDLSVGKSCGSQFGVRALRSRNRKPQRKKNRGDKRVMGWHHAHFTSH